MESTQSTFSKITPYLIYVAVFISVVGLGYLIYYSLTPDENKALSKAESNFKSYQEVTKLAPLGCPTKYRLCDYYIASSAYTVFPGHDIYDYVSDQIVPLAIKAGARLVEFDIYADENDKPVVGLKNQKLGVDYAYNTVSFESCCVSIINNAFNTVYTPVGSDPFLISLVFHTSKVPVINACAEILKTTCRSHMLDEGFGYQRKNVAVEPICNLQNKIVILSGPEVKGSKMEELVNLSWGTSHLRRMTYNQASQPHDPDEMINYNRDNITIVVPEIGGDLKNSNPQILFTYGCQLNLMNYGSLDSMMEVYVGEFQEKSVVLKPDALRPLKPKKYTKPALPDPDVSFQPMQKTSPIYNITI